MCVQRCAGEVAYTCPLKGYPLLPCGKNSPNKPAPTCQRGWQQYAQNSVIPREKLSLREDKFTSKEIKKLRKQEEKRNKTPEAFQKLFTLQPSCVSKSSNADQILS